MPNPSSPPNRPDAKYGAASRFDFDNPQKWYTVPSVPLLDEHELTGSDGRTIATVDRAALEEIARNNNQKVRTTGDPATLILGHTSDDPRAPEKPAVGFVTNFQVRPFKRDEQGRVVYALHGDYKLRPEKKHLVEDYPRRSVELWWSKKDVDPIALLGGSSPERELGALVRNARMNHVALAHEPRSSVRNSRHRTDDDVVRFHRRGEFTIENYAIHVPPPKYRYGKNGKVETVKPGFTDGKFKYGESQMHGMNGKKKSPSRYEDECGDKVKYAEDEFDGGDDAVDTVGAEDGGDWTGSMDDTDDGAGGEESPAVRELLQSKSFRDLQDKIDQIFSMLTGGGPGGPEDAGGVGGDDAMGAEMPPPATGPMAGAAPGGETGGAPPMGGMPPGEPDEEESRRGMGASPVQMSSTAMPGSGDVYTPGMGTKPTKRMSRRGEMNGRTTGRTVESRIQQLERENAELRRYQREDKLRYSQTEARRRVEALLADGYLFGATPQDHAEGVAETEQHFANLLFSAPTVEEGVKDVEYEEGIVRRRYSRKRPDPTRTPGLSRYTRDTVHEAATDRAGRKSAEFEPISDEESCELADLMSGFNPHRKKYSREEAGKIITARRAQR